MTDKLYSILIAGGAGKTILVGLLATLKISVLPAAVRACSSVPLRCSRSLMKVRYSLTVRR